MKQTIAIVGAGLGGLILARVLQRHGVGTMIYEAEESFSARGQGGLLDIHEYNGQPTLLAAGLLDEVMQLALPGEDAKRVCSPDGEVLFDYVPIDGAARPEVSRRELRKLLIESLPSEAIQWGYKLATVSETSQGQRVLTFTNGRTAVCDLLVGADGAWSKVRPFVSKAVPEYSGIVFIETHLFDAASRFPRSAEAIGSGTLMAVSPGKGILAHRNADSSVQVYVALSKPETWVNEFDGKATNVTLSRFADEFDGWAPHLRTLAAESDTPPVLRPIYALPIAHRWNRTTGVTLLGDAAHLMSPFAGEGANLAMLDGAQLAAALLGRPDDIDGALLEFESDLFKRSLVFAERSQENLKQFFGMNAPQSVVTLFRKHLA